MTAKVRAKVSLVAPANVLLISVRFLVRTPSNYEASLSFYPRRVVKTVVNYIVLSALGLWLMLNVEIFHDEDCDPCIPVLVDFQVL